MKKLVLTSLVAVFALPVAANAGWYAAGHLATDYSDGVSMFDTTKLDLALGYAFENGIRLEADIMNKTISHNTSTNFDLYYTADQGSDFGLLSAKVAYDFDTGTEFTPYIGAGIKSIGYFSDETEDGLQIDGMAIAGVKYTLNETWALDLQYNRNFGAVAMFNSDSYFDQYKGDSTWKLGAVYKF
ncbi:MAG: outer membrane beta-barrel protein [Rickettsiales bacterium]|jgi:opacity protein-like surface antigen|nr:outer membrane beta-barrel protein [Rickettsiales bacterium]